MDFEQGTGLPQRSQLDAITSALKAAGVEFIRENGGGAGVRLTKRSSIREPGPGAHLEKVLQAFATHRLPKAVEQAHVGDLQFVRAGPQATLMEGSETIGLVTLRDTGAVFDPPLLTEDASRGRALTEEDIWNWIIAAWQKCRKAP